MREKLKTPIRTVLATYVPHNNPAIAIAGGYKNAFDQALYNYFADAGVADGVVDRFSKYLGLLGTDLANLTDPLIEKFIIRLLNRLSDSGTINQLDDDTEKSIQLAVDAELNIDTTAKKELLLLSFSEDPSIIKNFNPTFEHAINEFLTSQAHSEKLNRYLENYATSLSTDNEAVLAYVDGVNIPNPILIKRFIHNVLGRLIYKRKTQIDALTAARVQAGIEVVLADVETEADRIIGDKQLNIDEAINNELGWYGVHEKLKTPIQTVLAAYAPRNRAAENNLGVPGVVENAQAQIDNPAPGVPTEYKTIFKRTLYEHFSDLGVVDGVVDRFNKYLGLLGTDTTKATNTHIEKFIYRLLNRLSDNGTINQIDDNTKANIKCAVDAELHINDITPAQIELLNFDYSKEDVLTQDYKVSFEEQINNSLQDPALTDDFKLYFETFAAYINTMEQPVRAFNDDGTTNPELLRRFIRHVLRRLDLGDNSKLIFRKRHVYFADIQNDIKEAIKDELDCAKTWSRETITHTIKPFDKTKYIWEGAILDYSTYLADDAVTMASRALKMVTYSGGIAPDAKPETLTGHNQNAMTGNVNLMYGYLGVTVLSFLLVPARLLYRLYKDGWNDKVDEQGNKKPGLKSFCKDNKRDLIFEATVNSIIVACTAAAVFAPVISWPFVLVMFTFGFIASMYSAYYTRQAAKKNTADLAAIAPAIQEVRDAITSKQNQLRQELTHANPNMGKIKQLTKDLNSDMKTLENLLAKRHELEVRERNNNSFFGKYGTFIKMGIAGTTVIAHTLIATVFAVTFAAAFWPALVVMSVLAAAALTYIIVKQVRAYRLQKAIASVEHRLLENIELKPIRNHLQIQQALGASGQPAPAEQTGSEQAVKTSSDDEDESKPLVASTPPTPPTPRSRHSSFSTSVRVTSSTLDGMASWLTAAPKSGHL